MQSWIRLRGYIDAYNTTGLCRTFTALTFISVAMVRRLSGCGFGLSETVDEVESVIKSCKVIFLACSGIIGRLVILALRGLLVGSTSSGRQIARAVLSINCLLITDTLFHKIYRLSDNV